MQVAIASGKTSLNTGIADRLEHEAAHRGIKSLGRVPYDPAVTQSQIARRTVIETGNGPAAQALHSRLNSP